jgi:hypothetical protein
VSTEDGVGLAVGDELAEAVGPAVGDGPEQVVVTGDAGYGVVALRGLGFSEANLPYSGSVKLPLGITSYVACLADPRTAFLAAMRPSSLAV